MQSVLQILVVNEPRKLKSRVTGNEFTLHEAECVLCNDDGSPVRVGVLRIPDALKDWAKPGFFFGTFGLDVGWKDRQVEAVLTALTPLKKSGAGFVADTPKAVL